MLLVWEVAKTVVIIVRGSSRATQVQAGATLLASICREYDNLVIVEKEEGFLRGGCMSNGLGGSSSG